MSSRLMKKILKAQENALQQQHESEDESDSPEASSASQRNPFDLLDEEDLDEKEQTDNSDGIDQVDKTELTERSSIRKNDEKHSSKGADTNNTVLSSNLRSKKKKKKSKKNSHTTTGNPQKSLDESLENLSVDGNSSCHEYTASHSRQAKMSNISGTNKSSIATLQIDPKFLSAENELRRIFGSKVVSSFERNSQSGSSRQAHGSRRGSSNHRKTILVHPSEHWPRWDGSLTMELLGTKDGINYFRYVHSASYSQAQRAFEAAKAIHDLNGIVNVLMHNPYHIESLVTLAEYYKFSGELQMSSDAIARCLYAMECAWHPVFSLLQGKCQLKYSHETNKPFFSVLFSHMKNMDRRGCHRSALEICKLLLSLDSDDPMGALFCVDYYSLRAEEYSWLEHFSEEYKTDNSLWLFPNFSYSLAICRFKLENQEKQEHVTKTESLKAVSTDLMKQALMLHPTVLKKLVAKVPLKDQAFSRIVGHGLFSSEKSGSLSLDHLVNIYVERNYLIWRLPDIQKFLKDSALLVIEMLDRKETDARDWSCVRKEAFSSDKNEYSHLLVSEFSDSVPTLPPDNLQNFMVDPRLVGNNGGEQQAANRPVRDLSNRNALAVLFESMLPWVDFGTEHVVEDHPHGQEG